MRVMELRFHTLHIPFRQRFGHASATRDVTSSLWVEAVGVDGLTGCGEACPRPYVTGETLETARDFFASVRGEVMTEIVDAPTLRAWVAGNTARIDAHPAAWCAIELALIDLFSRLADLSAEAWLGLPRTAGAFEYSAVMGDADPVDFAATLARYREFAMTDVKIKLSGDLARDQAKLAALTAAGRDISRLRLDANNLWRDADAAIAWLSALNAPAFAIEEPLGVDQISDLPRLARVLGVAVILDESLTRVSQLETLTKDTNWIANVRVSKLGGLLRTLALVEAATARGHGVIVGAQVGETSLLTRVSLIAARAAHVHLIGQEGAFGTLLLKNDVCEKPIMFGHGGRLQFESDAPGWGIACEATSWLRP